jgi:hypothetical protein
MNGNAYGRHQASGSRSDGVSGHNTGRTAGTQTGPARATRRFSKSSITLLAASIIDGRLRSNRNADRCAAGDGHFHRAADGHRNGDRSAHSDSHAN